MTVKDIRPALRQFLLADASISTTVEAARIYPGKIPQGVTSASIVYTLVSDAGDYHSQGPSGLARPRMQIDAWAQTLDAAAALDRMIQARIDGYRGTMGTGDDLINVNGVFRDSTSREDWDDSAKLWRRGRDYFIWFDER